MNTSTSAGTGYYAKYRVGARFTAYHKQALNMLTFDDAGLFLVSSGLDDCIGLYDATLGRPIDYFNVKKYGAMFAQFTHSNKAVIYASNPYASTSKRENLICYHDLQSNVVLRAFRNFSNPISALSMCPSSDLFASSSLQDPVCLWDLKQTSPTHKIPVHTLRSKFSTLPRSSLIKFHPNGVQLCILQSSGHAYQYDLRHLDAGPISAGRLPDFRPEDLRENRLDIGIQQLSYSATGDKLFISLNSRCLGAIRASDGKCVWSLDYSQIEHLTDVGWNGAFDVTPDGKFLCTTSDNGRIHWFNADTGERCGALYFETSPISQLRFNPAQNMFATSTDNGAINLWILPTLSQVRDSQPTLKSILKRH